MILQEDEEYESVFSLEGLTDLETYEPEKKEEISTGKITATLADFPVNNWNSENDAQHIVDWYNDLAKERGIEQLSFREFMNMTGNRHFDSINDAQDFLDFALMVLNWEGRDREWHTSQTQPGEGTWVGLVIFWFFTLVWCAVSGFATVMIGGAIVADLGTGDWTPVDGIITDSGVDESYDDEGGTSYCIWVEYEYTIENRTYDGASISYSKDGNCGSGDANANDEYPPGKNVTVYVNPENHEEAVLLTGLSGIDFFMCCFCIFPLVGIVLFVLSSMATYNSFMNPEKYVVGNFVPGDTSDSVDANPQGGRQPHPGVELGETIAEGKRVSVTISIIVLLVINGFVIASYVADNEYADDFDVANEAMEGTSEWPTTTAWFSENFTFNWLDSGEYFGGSIIIYCLNTSESWECGDNESGYDRIEIPYRCTLTEQVGPLENPCDWAMQMFVSDSYWNGFPHHYHELWNTYSQCEWEGEPEDENLWSCYWSSTSDSAEYDTWWYYCEHHQNQGVWRCTDELGEEISSPDNQNGTEYSPPVVQTTVNYDPDDPTRIAFVEELEWHTGGGSDAIILIIIIAIIDVVIIARIVVPIVRKQQNNKSHV